MSTLTLPEILAKHDVALADETLAELIVPCLTGPQRQGDVMIIPRPPLGSAERKVMAIVDKNMGLVGPAGVAVVRGEATGNTHLLHAEGVVRWSAHDGQPGDVTLGILEVEEGAAAYLIHTDEHGANGIGPGTYVLHGKREQAAAIRRVAD